MSELDDILRDCASSPTDAVFGWESPESNAMRLLGEVGGANRIRPQIIDGKEYYVLMMRPEQGRDIIKDMQARENWKDYYRSVRILRRLRQEDTPRFRAMSRLWYKVALKEELTLDIRERERVANILRAEKDRPFGTLRNTDFYEGETK